MTERPTSPPSLDETVAFLQSLIQTESLPGAESEIAQRVAGEMTRLGYDTIEFDTYGNVIGTLRGRGEAPPINFNTHLDHVDVGDHSRWPHPPFGGEVHDDKIWGRGAVDIKGPLAAQVHGVARAGAKGRPPGDVHVTCVVQEEIGGVGARHLAKQLFTPIIVVGEPSANTLRRGHRGRTELQLHLVGRSIHASVPEKGINPLPTLGRFLTGLANAKRGSDAELGESSVSPTLLSTDQTSPNVVPGEVWLTCDWRNVPGENAEQILESLQAVLTAALGEGTKGDLSIPVVERTAYTGSTMDIPAVHPAYLLSLDDPAITVARDIVEEAIGPQEPIGIWEFATDGSHFAQEGMKPVGFGPGDPYLAHTVDEHISIADLEPALEVNRRLARELAPSVVP